MAEPAWEGLVLNAGSGGSSLAVETYDSKLYQAEIACWWNGTSPVTVSETNPMPVSVNNAAGSGVYVRPSTGAAFPVTDNDGSITVDGTVAATQSGTWNIGAVATITNTVTVSATDLDVRDLSASTDSVVAYANTVKDGSGTNYVPLVDSSGHLQIDVLSGGGGTEYAVDAAAPAAPTGRAIVVERDDALAGLTLAEGDWSQLFCDANGALWVAVNGTVTVDATGSGDVPITLDSEVVSVDDNASSLTVDTTGTSGLEVIQDTAGDLNVTEASAADIKTAVELIDNAVYVDDADWTDSTSSHLLVGGVYQSSPQSITDGDVGPFQVTSNGYLITSVNGSVTVDATGSGDVPITLDSEVVSVDDNASSLTVDTTGTSGLEVVQDTAADLNVTEASAADILTSVQIMDDWDDGSDHCKVSIEADNVGIGPTEYTEDGAVPANPVGPAVMVERDDALGGLTPAEGDWTQLFCDANGALWVAVNGSVTVDCNSSNITVDGVPAPLNVVGGGAEAAALRVTIADDSTGVVTVDDGGSTVSVDDGGSSLTIDGTVAATQNGTWNIGTLTTITNTVTVTGSVGISGNLPDTAAGDLAAITSLNGKVTACNTGAIVISSGTVTGITNAVDVNLQSGEGTDLTATTVGADHALDVNLVQAVSLDVSAATVTVDCNASDVTVTGVPAPLNVVGGGTEATAMRVTIANDSTGVVTVDDGGSSLTIDGSVTATLAASDGTDIGDVDVATLPADTFVAEGGALGKGVLLQGDDGTDRNNLQTDANGYLKTVAQVSTATQEVVGDVAEDQNATGNPVLVGGRYDSSERSLDNTDVGALALSPEGWMMVGNQSSYLFDGVTRCQVKRASGLAASGTVAMVAAVASKKIRCLALAFLATSGTVTNIYVANDDNDILGDSSNPIPLSVTAAGDDAAGFVLPWNPGGWFETDTANEALNVVLSAAQDIVYAITYIEVD